MSKTFYITTPIYYVNDRPHIGHASTTVWADVQARYRRQKGGKVFFLTGLDEHGTKVQQAAEKKQISPQQHCDEMAPHFIELWKALNIQADDFVRTTQPRHQVIVQKILTQLYEKGEIYKKTYSGWYSKTAEQFVTEKEMVDGKFPSHLGEVIQLDEENYFFKMSKYQGWLIDYINKNPDWIQPANRKNEILGALQKPLEDLCISRPKERLSWGIPIPFDQNYVTFVWFDALVNYISIVGYGSENFKSFWPADFHLLAKDILTPHAIYWPTMLHAIGLEMPQHIMAHGWWLFGKEKMSKSLGNVVSPHDFIPKYGVDSVRYFICRELQLANDTDFSEERFQQRFNADLANDLGNLVNRSINMLKKYHEGKVPPLGAKSPLDEDLIKTALDSFETFHREMPLIMYGTALEAVWKLVSRANRYVEENAPWKLAKDPAQAERLGTVMHLLTQTAALLSNFVLPVMPETAAKIASQLNRTDIPELRLSGEGILSILKVGHEVGAPTPLFPRILENK